MRTMDEITTKAKNVDDFFGFERDVLLSFLDFEHAKGFLKDDVTADQWAEGKIGADDEHGYPSGIEGGSWIALTRENVLALMKSYMRFAWTKVEDHRGISANRSVDKMVAYLWLLGDEDLTTKIDSIDYAQYGAPKLKAICEVYDFPIPEDASLLRMMNGERCGADHECGCG